MVYTVGQTFVVRDEKKKIEESQGSDGGSSLSPCHQRERQHAQHQQLIFPGQARKCLVDEQIDVVQILGVLRVDVTPQAPVSSNSLIRTHLFATVWS